MEESGGREWRDGSREGGLLAESGSCGESLGER